MLKLLILAFFFLVTPPTITFAEELRLQPEPLPRLSAAARIDLLVDGAIRRGLISGGVVHIGSREGLLFEKAYGRIAPDAMSRPIARDTIFDLASLTKVVATTASVMKLAEEGKLSLVDPVRRWFPELDGKGKDELLLLNLLTHTSGLDDFPLDPAAPMQSAISGAAGQKLKGELGSRFHYADINFILLAEVVRRVSGETLDLFAAQRFYRPLGMKDTGFHPPAEKLERIAPTFGDGTLTMTAVPQDYPARQLGGVAGHPPQLTGRIVLGDGCHG